jgi:hypothetical protein
MPDDDFVNLQHQLDSHEDELTRTNQRLHR